MTTLLACIGMMLNPSLLLPQDYQLTAVVTAEGKVNVSWVAPAGRPGTDWIGISKKGVAAYDPQTWMYSNGTRLPSPATPIQSHVVLNSPVEPGVYEARYYLANGSTVGASVEFTVGVVPPAGQPPIPSPNTPWKLEVYRYRPDDTVSGPEISYHNSIEDAHQEAALQRIGAAVGEEVVCLYFRGTVTFEATPKYTAKWRNEKE